MDWKAHLRKQPAGASLTGKALLWVGLPIVSMFDLVGLGSLPISLSANSLDYLALRLFVLIVAALVAILVIWRLNSDFSITGRRIRGVGFRSLFFILSGGLQFAFTVAAVILTYIGASLAF